MYKMKFRFEGYNGDITGTIVTTGKSVKECIDKANIELNRYDYKIVDYDLLND